MKPVDFRNATFDSLAGFITGQRERVFHAWGAHGPCTTEHLAQASGISILTLRPRTTELYQLGFSVLAAVNREIAASPRGALYRVATPEEFAAFLAEQRAAAIQPQRQLALGV